MMNSSMDPLKVQPLPLYLGLMMDLFILMADKKAFLQDSIGGQSNKSVLFSQLSEMFNDNYGGPCPKTSFINSENTGECGGNLVGFSIKGLTNMEFPFAPEKFFKLYNISTNTFIDYLDETYGTMVAAFPFETSVAKERVLWFDALVGDASSEVSGRCNGGKKASQQKCTQAGHSWQPMDMKNCRPQLNGTFNSADCLDSVRNWFVTKNDNSIASSRPNAKNISLVDFDNFCIDVATTVQPLVWDGNPLQGFSEAPATTQVSLFESYFNEGDHQTLLGLREIDNIVKPNCGNTSPPPPPPSGSCGGRWSQLGIFRITQMLSRHLPCP